MIDALTNLDRLAEMWADLDPVTGSIDPVDDWRPHIRDAIREIIRLRAALAAPPVAPGWIPAHERVPAPLTDEQIDMITAEQWGAGLGAPYAAYRAYARAVEAAHGITAESQSGRDWSLLEATQESLREHMAEIQRLRAAVAAERERCAVLVEDTQRQWPGDGLDGWLLAAEIRAAA